MDNFTGVSSAGSFDVFVTQSDEFHVEVVAQESIIPIIETYVSGSTLRIETKDGTCFRSGSPVEVHVSLPELEVLKLTGSGGVMADMAESQVFECSNSGSGRLSIDTVYAESYSISNSGSGSVGVLESNTKKLEMVQSGSGRINGGTVSGTSQVDIRHSSSGLVEASIVNGIAVNAILSGSGRINLDGEASVAEYILNSSGRIDALELEVADVETTVTGSGKIFVWATEILEATVTGSGDVLYRGQPTVSFLITGSGDVRPY